MREKKARSGSLIILELSRGDLDNSTLFTGKHQRFQMSDQRLADPKNQCHPMEHNRGRPGEKTPAKRVDPRKSNSIRNESKNTP